MSMFFAGACAGRRGGSAGRGGGATEERHLEAEVSREWYAIRAVAGPRQLTLLGRHETRA